MTGDRILVAAVLCAAIAANGRDWPADLWLDRGGFWTNRVEVKVENRTGKALAGAGVEVRMPKGSCGVDVRVTDDAGTLLQYSRKAGDLLTIPVTAAAGATSSYWAYWGNPSAKKLRNCRVKVRRDIADGAIARVGAPESLRLATVGANEPWPAGGWNYRVVLRAANLGDAPRSDAAFRVRLAEATRETANPVWELRHAGLRVPAKTYGSDILYRVDLPPRTIAVHYLYVKAGPPLSAAELAERADSESLLPNDTRIDDEPRFPKGLRVDFAHIGELELTESARAKDLSIEPADLSVLVFGERAVRDTRGGFTLALARNEGETLQLAVRSPRRSKRFACEASAPRNAAGTALEVSPGWVESVFVDAPSAFYVHDTKAWHLMYPHTRHPTSDGWSGWWPDPIAPGGGTELKANVTKAFRLLVRTTAATVPGEYHGTLVWKEDGREVRRDPYTVRVWNFTLPEERGFTAAFDTRGCTTQAEIDRIYALLKAYGLEGDQSCRSLEFTRDGEGRVQCDFRRFDELTAEFFGKWGFKDAYFPRNPFSAFGWARKPADFLAEKAYEDGETDRSRLRPGYRRAYQAALRLFWDHLKAKGWERRFTLYVSDEPHLHLPEVVAQQKAICDMIHEVDPAIPIYSSTWRHCPGWDDCLDVWGVSASGRFPVEKIRELQAKGRRFWFTTDAQFPLDSPYMATERLFPVIARFLGAEKYECWNCVNYPKEDTWICGTDGFKPRFGIPGKKDRWVRVPCGDGVLMYPPRDGGNGPLVPTVRIDAIRDGLEDYEYIRLLEADGSAAAKALVEGYRGLVVIPNAGGRYSKSMMPDPSRISKLRSAAGQLLDRRAAAMWNGRSLPVEEVRVSACPLNQRYPGWQRSREQTALADLVSFDVEAPGELALEIPEDVREFRIRPLGRIHGTRLEKGWLRIGIGGPEQFVVEFPGSSRRAVHVFADPPFRYEHVAHERYFGPGEHHPGLIMPTDGETICIDRGAVVHGNIVIDGARDVRIVGRGILDASDVRRADRESDIYRTMRARGWDDFSAGQCCTAFIALGATNLTVSGIVLRDSPRWALILRNACRDAVIDGVKLVGMWRYNSDGIDVCASENVTVRNSFVRSFDDCLIARGPSLFGESGDVRGLLATNCVLWCDWGANLKVQAQHVPTVIEDIRLVDCVFANLDETGAWITARPGSESTVIRNVLLEGIEVDLPGPRWQREYENRKPAGEPFGFHPRDSANLLSVNHYDYHEGDPLKLHLRYDGIRLSNFRVFGDEVPLTCQIDDRLERTNESWFAGPAVQGPDNFVITNVVFDGVPPLAHVRMGRDGVLR